MFPGIGLFRDRLRVECPKRPDVVVDPVEELLDDYRIGLHGVVKPFPEPRGRVSAPSLSVALGGTVECTTPFLEYRRLLRPRVMYQPIDRVRIGVAGVEGILQVVAGGAVGEFDSGGLGADCVAVHVGARQHQGQDEGRQHALEQGLQRAGRWTVGLPRHRDDEFFPPASVALEDG
ncbi:hypothetical protein CTA1_7664 [Colletotrichum tanaceti]|uniref:Uncharacterized protein n=1 Tax=Colletotrichum tanaceti TaxID=1306861 RepID=A0A4U6X547_9PEZI|nr:hypothetical protein CTA1_7664 [Colletotrichum tanaceti]